MEIIVFIFFKIGMSHKSNSLNTMSTLVPAGLDQKTSYPRYAMSFVVEKDSCITNNSSYVSLNITPEWRCKK